MEVLKLKSFDDLIPENYTGIIERSDGDKLWYKKGEIHREDGPALEYKDGTKVWCNEGEFHKEDGPAVEYKNEKKLWYIKGFVYSPIYLEFLIETSIYLGKEIGKYNLKWLRFLTKENIEEFPIISGMEDYEYFMPLFKRLGIDK